MERVEEERMDGWMDLKGVGWIEWKRVGWMDGWIDG